MEQISNKYYNEVLFALWRELKYDYAEVIANREIDYYNALTSIRILDTHAFWFNHTGIYLHRRHIIIKAAREHHIIWKF